MTIDEWEDKYEPLQDDDGVEIQFGIYSESKKIDDISKMYSDISGSEPFNHVWTLIDGDIGKLIISNGYRVCNSINYFVTKKPWTEKYVEANYE